MMDVGSHFPLLSFSFGYPLSLLDAVAIAVFFFILIIQM